MANQQHLFKQGFNFVGAAADETGNAGVVRYAVAGQGFEDDVGFAGPLDLSTYPSSTPAMPTTTAAVPPMTPPYC